MRIRVILAAVVAMLAMSAAPASAATGWTFHSGGYNDDIFTSNPCLDTGQAMVQAGTIADYQCRYNYGNHLFDLYVVSGTWTYHSEHYNDDGWATACYNAGQALVANNTITTYQCRWEPDDYIELWVVV